MTTPSGPERPDDRQRALILAVRWSAGAAAGVAGARTRDEALAVLGGSPACLGERGWLETDPGFRQIVPYVLLHDGGRVLRYRRGSAGAESRLHGRYSYGFGGHIDLADVVAAGGAVDIGASVAGAARREVAEEVGVAGGDILATRFLGLIAETDSDVERVHLGWVEAWEVRDLDRVTGAESAIREVGVVPLAGAAAADGGPPCERWSELALPWLVPARAGTRP